MACPPQFQLVPLNPELRLTTARQMREPPNTPAQIDSSRKSVCAGVSEVAWPLERTRKARTGIATTRAMLSREGGARNAAVIVEVDTKLPAGNNVVVTG